MAAILTIEMVRVLRSSNPESFKPGSQLHLQNSQVFCESTLGCKRVLIYPVAGRLNNQQIFGLFHTNIRSRHLNSHPIRVAKYMNLPFPIPAVHAKKVTAAFVEGAPR
jgi:hypothetical protein